MGSRENAAQRECWLEFGKQGAKVFRLNTGRAWAGRAERMPDGSVRIEYPQLVNLGLGYPDNKPVVGASDLIGWTSVVITPEMVGQRVAVFTAGEAKAPKGQPTEDQRRFIDQVRADGGIAGVVRTPTDVRGLLHEWKTRHKQSD
jgi:VRR-NUC domain.